MMRMELHLSQKLCGQLFWIKEFMSVWAVGGRGREPLSRIEIKSYTKSYCSAAILYYTRHIFNYVYDKTFVYNR